MTMKATRTQHLIIAFVQTFASLSTVSRAHWNVGQVKVYENVLTQQQVCSGNGDRSQEDSQLALGNRSSWRDAAGAIVDLLLAAESDELSGKLSNLRVRSRQLVEIVDSLRNSDVNDNDTRYGISFDATTADSIERKDTRNWLERLARLVEFAKYELDDVSRRSALDSAVVVLIAVVNEMKTQSKLLYRRRELSALRLNLFNQTNDE